ncbi:hypothetical protein HC725_16225 [Vibrio sp. S17_S38]|uniref:hypothetical protein n=1 Tax=Vibrio sp. S17_S38 TaxID=2720229 RepID=UPI00167FF121|nr:hypothetical protein [Vibrio sp. S17_S38]MBD1574797.1 hypothetical protein [Vibrio sp. S17_S38]
MIEFLIVLWCLSWSVVLGMDVYFTRIKKEEKSPFHVVAMTYLVAPFFVAYAFGLVLGSQSSELIDKN